MCVRAWVCAYLCVCECFVNSNKNGNGNGKGNGIGNGNNGENSGFCKSKKGLKSNLEGMIYLIKLHSLTFIKFIHEIRLRFITVIEKKTPHQ
jgi:hypothetical protein